MEVDKTSLQSKGEFFFFFFFVIHGSLRKILHTTINLRHKHLSLYLYFCCSLVDNKRIFKFKTSFRRDKKLGYKFCLY